MKEFFLKTKRLGFSIWNEEDILEALALWGNPEVTRYITADGKMSKEQIQQRLQKEIDTYKSDSVQYWPVYCLDTCRNIGCCGLRPYDSENNILELGVHIKDEYWGKGFALEACLAVIEYAFEVYGVDALFAGHNPKNSASAKMLKKLGFKYTHDEYYAPTGLYHPSYLMIKQDYKSKVKNYYN